MRRRRSTVVFVGGFDDRRVKGGQIFACKALVASPLSEEIRWILIDSTMVSLPPPPAWRRAIVAAGRLARFSRELSARPAAVLLFASSGASFLEKGLMVVLARLCGVPAVLCPRSGLIIDMVESSALGRALVTGICRAASLIVCQGGNWADFYGRLAPRTPRRVIPNFVDTAAYASVPDDRGDPDTRVLFLGWMERNKGIWELLDAAEQLQQEGHRFKLVMAGSGGELPAFKARLAGSPLADHVEVVGWVGAAEKLRLLSWANVLVLPSHREGLPNVVLEAMAAGRAVVASEVGSIPEVIQQARTGLLCAPRDAASLGSSLRRLVTDPALRAGMGAEGRRRAQANHSVQSLWPSWREAILSNANDH